MRSLASLLCLGLLVGVRAAEPKKDLSISCLLFDDFSFYDLRTMQRGDADYAFQDPATPTGEKYYFNLCAHTISDCDTATTQEIFAYKKNEATGACTPLTDFSMTSPKVNEKKSGEKYLQMAYGSPEAKTCTKGTEQVAYSFRLNLVCGADNDAADPMAFSKLDLTDPCAPLLEVSHPTACPVFSATAFSRFFLDHPVLLGLIAIPFGLIVAFYGRKFFPITIFGTGALVGFAITILLFSMLSMLTSASARGQGLSFLNTFLQYFVSFLIGIFVGFILQKMLRIGAAIMGAIGGFFLGVMLYSLTLSWVHSDIALYILSAIGAATMAFLSLRHYDNIVIIGTSMLGGYAFVRGFSLFLPGSFPNESEILHKISEGEMQTEFYVYVAIFVLMFGLGIAYQRKMRTVESLQNFIKM